jgi:hypothetical protein
VIFSIEHSDSHALQLAFRLLDLGAIKSGAFTWVRFQHDDNCAALRTQSALDCRCNVEAVIEGDIFSFEEFVGAR